MTALVVDALALVEYLLRTARAGFIEESIRAAEVDLHIPALCDIELASVLRRLLLEGRLSVDRAVDALDDLQDMPLTRHGHQLLVARVLALRENFSVYDATYVALAEQLDASLLTGDKALARAVRAHLGLSVIVPSL